jgi:hypothetical protein
MLIWMRTGQVLKVFLNQLDVLDGRHVFLSEYFGPPAMAQCYLQCPSPC